MLDFIKKTAHYRKQATHWQRKHDPAAPKAGHLAPDSEIHP